jgi:hypothetical protein
MEEFSDSTSEVSVSRSLLKELIELRALRAEKEMLQKTNQFYVSQLSQLEVKISELKAIAQAREAEIHSLRDRLYQQDTERDIKGFTEARSLGELEAKVAMLEEENLQFQDYSSLRMENERLHLELTHSNQVKQAYEEKYREAKVELLGLQAEEASNEVSRDGFETQKKHPEGQEARLRHAKDLEKEHEKTAKLEMLLREKEAGERMLGKELNDAQLKCAGLEGQLTQLLEENRRLSEMISQQWRVSSGTISPIPSEPAQSSLAARSNPTAIKETVQTSPSRVASRPARDLNPPLKPTPVKSVSSTSSPHSSVRGGNPQPAVYVPSFMRNKKALFPTSMLKSESSTKVKSHQVKLTLDDSDDDFDLSIPEEVHLYF